MKNVIVMVVAMILVVPAHAEKKRKPLHCPIIVDTDTSEYIITGDRYQPLKSVAQAIERGFDYVEGFGQEPIPTAAPSNNFTFKGSQSKNSGLFTLTNTQTLVSVTKSKNCYLDIDFNEPDGSIAENVLSFPSNDNNASGTTYIYATGQYYIDVSSSCSNWNITVYK